MKFIFKEPKNLNGIKTYRNDIINKIVPYLKDKIDDSILLTDNNIKDDYKDAKKIVRILHNSSNENLNRKKIVDNIDHVYITHYDYFLEKINEKDYLKGMFIPMSINIDNVPKPIKNKKDKILYYQNLRHPKTEVYNKLKRHINFDILSKGSFNDDRKPRNHKQCLDIVNQYQYVITVGRGVLEAIAMDCKIINAGKNYSGTIYNQKQFDIFHKCNFNTYYNKELTKDSLFEDIFFLKEKCDIINTEKVNMDNYLKDYYKACLI